MGFLILSHQRSGATMLTQALNSHPELTCLGEINCKVDQPFVNYWHRYPDRLGTVLKYDQLADVDPEFLLRRGRIIHLIRRDTLACAVSDVINRYKDRYHVPAHTRWPLATKPVELVPEDVAQRQHHIEGLIARWRTALGESNRMIEVYYEDLTDGEEVTRIAETATDRMCAYLNVPYAPLVTQLKRTAPPIVNWSDVALIAS